MSAIMNAYRQHSQELDNNTLNQNKLSFVGKNTEPETDIRKHTKFVIRKITAVCSFEIYGDNKAVELKIYGGVRRKAWGR